MMGDTEFLDYYKHYCELTIWFKKIVLYQNKNAVITVQDIASELISERNKILEYIPNERRRDIRTNLNAIATSYHSKINKWNKTQKITIDMV
ncbi:MAG: hypothetical protein V4649_06405 [Bacteroidota bacterium]